MPPPRAWLISTLLEEFQEVAVPVLEQGGVYLDLPTLLEIQDLRSFVRTREAWEDEERRKHLSANASELMAKVIQYRVDHNL